MTVWFTCAFTEFPLKIHLILFKWGSDFTFTTISTRWVFSGFEQSSLPEGSRVSPFCFHDNCGFETKFSKLTYWIVKLSRCTAQLNKTIRRQYTKILKSGFKNNGLIRTKVIDTKSFFFKEIKTSSYLHKSGSIERNFQPYFIRCKSPADSQCKYIQTLNIPKAKKFNIVKVGFSHLIWTHVHVLQLLNTKRTAGAPAEGGWSSRWQFHWSRISEVRVSKWLYFLNGKCHILADCLSFSNWVLIDHIIDV